MSEIEDSLVDRHLGPRGSTGVQNALLRRYTKASCSGKLGRRGGAVIGSKWPL